jgi:antitoxin PrlF
MSTTVTTKGQVTIPKAIRERLGLKPGSAVEFDIGDDGRVVMLRAGRRTKAIRSRFNSIRGVLKSDMTTEEIMALMRGDPAEA